MLIPGINANYIATLSVKFYRAKFIFLFKNPIFYQIVRKEVIV